MRRTVLVIAYFFPPLGGAGVQRVLKFVKYLPEHGFRSLVVSSEAADYPARDLSLAADIPLGTRIVRARDPRVLRQAQAVFNRVGMRQLRALAAWPDFAAAWIPAAAVAAARAIDRHKPDVIFSSSPPFSAHLVACLTSRRAALPWVADFRDEFTANPEADWRSEFVQGLNARLENRVMREAHHIITAAPHYEIAGSRSHPRRRTWIPNGVDPADLPLTPALAPRKHFRLSFVGSLYGERDLSAVASALRELAQDGHLDASKCELRLIGNMWLPKLPDAGPILVTRTGYVSHEEALNEMQRSSVLISYVPQSNPAPPGKIFEYLASGRPILCVGRRDSLASELVETWSAGSSVEADDQRGIAAALLDFYERWSSGRLVTPPQVRNQVLDRFSRRKLTADLASVLDSVVDHAGTGVLPASLR